MRQFLSTLIVSLFNLVITLPGLLYYFSIAAYYRHCLSTPIFPFDVNRTSIVFIHGRGGAPNDMLYLAQYDPFLSDKYNIILANLENTRSTSIQEDSNNLERQLAHVTGDIILVGLSKGGLVGAHYSTRDVRVKKLITISSPLHGTQLADYHYSDHVRENLGYKSQTITDIVQKVMDNVGCEYYHIVPQCDHVIVPTGSAYYKHVEPSHVFYYKGLASHMGVQLQPACAQQILAWL